MKVRPVFAWFDLWVGVYWDREARRVYLLPVPMVGLVFDFGIQRVLPEMVACGCEQCQADARRTEEE